MAVAKELSIMLENKRGALAELCTALAKVAVNIQALMVPNQPGLAPVRLVVNNLDVARTVLTGLGLKFSESDVIAVRVSDKLADRNVDVKYAYCSIAKGSGDAIVILAVSDAAAAAKVAK